jgi:DNA-binding NarL/FixJ family response regulator
VDAVARVRDGEPTFSPSLAALVLGEFRRMSGSAEPGLTARETEVLRLVAKGYTYKEIADQVFRSVKTSRTTSTTSSPSCSCPSATS